MSEPRRNKNIRIVKQPTATGIPITVQATPTPAPPLTDTIAAFESLVDEVRRRFIACYADEGLPMEIDLDADLPRGLWIALIHDGIGDSFDGDIEVLEAQLRGLRSVWLHWDFADDDYEEEELLVVLSVERCPMGEDTYEHFLDGERWISVSLRWLLLQLDSSDVAAALRNARPRP